MSIEKNKTNSLKHEESGWSTFINETLNNIKHTGALGVYCYLASKPEDWDICKVHLQNHFKCGREHIDTCIRYLKDIGLYVTSMTRDEKGKCTGWQTILRKKIPHEIVDNIQNTGNPSSGDLSRIRVSQKLGKPETGKSATTKEIGFKKEGSFKKNRSLSVFLDQASIKNHILLIIANRIKSHPKFITPSDDIVNQFIYWIGEERNFDIVLHKINSALKLFQDGKWNIPQGYNDITTQSIAKKDDEYERQKQEQIMQDAKIGRAISKAVKGEGFKAFQDFKQKFTVEYHANS
jgi:hypothetical protein